MGNEQRPGAFADPSAKLTIARRRPALGHVLRAVLIGALGGGSLLAGCRCRPLPAARDAAPAGSGHDAAVADAGSGEVPEPMTPAEARQRWVRLIGADQTRFRTMLELERDLRKRCTDPTHRLTADEIAPLGRFMAGLAPAARAPSDRRVVDALAARVKQIDGQRCDDALRGARALFGGVR
ncbi:MAG TPA: hypothetical protein VHN14_00325 [Kofleriaceae bacterium]|jgi:hypothetical protein|nr:hypothetical protein [Kofleriaceae bacterium]